MKLRNCPINHLRLILSVAFLVTAFLAASGATFAQGSRVMLANPAIDIDQCRNGEQAAPPIITANICAGSAWVNGNLGSENSHYVEGDFVPYRDKFSNLIIGHSYSVVIQYDTTQNGKHATDYLGTYNYTENGTGRSHGDADPCTDVLGSAFCTNAANVDTFDIPNDPLVLLGQDQLPGTGDEIDITEGVFTMWGGDITGVSVPALCEGTYAGTSKTCVTVTFTANVENPVLAWGGHISERIDWDFDNTAVSISGSPYHMRNIAWRDETDDEDLNIGNQDRSLSAAAVIYPAVVTIRKQIGDIPATVAGTDFTFTVGGGLVDLFQNAGTGGGSFGTTITLDDDGGADPTWSDQSQTLQIFNLQDGNLEATVTENTSQYWQLYKIECVSATPSGITNTATTYTANGSNPTITMNINEAEVLSCVYYNNLLLAAPATVSGRVVNADGYGIGGARLRLTNNATGDVLTAISNPFGYFAIDGAEVGNFYTLRVSHKRYTFAVDSITFTLDDNLDGIGFEANP